MDTESKITKEDDDKDKSSSPNNDCHMRDMIMKLPAPPAVRLSDVEGHAGQFALNGIYVRSLTKQYNGAPVFEFCGNRAFGYDDIILFLDDKDNWRVASQKAHVDAGADLCYLQAKELGKKAPVGTKSWYIYDGSQWNVDSKIKSTRVFDVEEILDAMKYREKNKIERERIMNSCIGFEISGLVGSAGQKCLNGIYRVIPDLTHCDKPVYEFLNDGKPCFSENVTDIVMHYDTAARWRICSKSLHMEGESQLCYVLVNGSSCTPPVGKKAQWMTFESSRWTTQKNIKVVGLDSTQIENRLSELQHEKSLLSSDQKSRIQIDCVQLSGIRGHCGQSSLNGIFIRIKDLKHNDEDVFEFTGGSAYGYSDMVLFCAKDKQWRVASRSDHMEAGKSLCFLMCSGARNGAPLEGVWSVYNGKSWESNLAIKAEQIEDPERIDAALRRKTQWKLRDSHARKATKGIRFENIGGNAGQKCLSGDYVAVEGLERNHRPVYRFTGPEAFGCKQIYLYFDQDGRWRVASKKSFDGISTTAYIMGVGFSGGTPVGSGEWQVFMNSKWTTLPEITTTPLDEAQAFQALMIEKERLKKNRQNMIDGVRLAGLTGKAGQEVLNGTYLLDKKLVINDHPTFMFQESAYGHDDLFIFLDSSGRWRIASKSEHYDAGTDICYCMGIGFLGSLPLTGDGDKMAGSWQTYNDGAWKPCREAVTIPIRHRSSPTHHTRSAQQDEAPASLPKMSLKPEDSREYRSNESDMIGDDSVGRFPNFGMSLKFLKRIRQDPRLLKPMYSLPYVCSGKFPYDAKYGTLVKPLTLQQLEKLDLKALRMLSLECRVFSELDGDAEFSRYSDLSPLKDTKSYIEALSRCPTTTTHVNIFIVKPDTLTAECCYAKKILKEEPQKANELVGVPTLFLSHAWRYEFKTLMSALDCHFEGKSEKEKLECRVWNDIFVEDQNNVDTKPKDYFFTAFLNAVGSIGNTLLVLDPWNAPIPFERSWCVWEIYSTIATQGQLHVSLSPDGRKAFWKNLVSNFNIIVNVVSSIDAEQASAFCLDDKKRIDQTIRDSVGFMRVNKLISDEMRVWLANSGKALLNSDDAEMSLRDRAQLVTCLASLLQDQGKIVEAEKYLRKGLSLYEESCGTDSPETIDTVVKLGKLLEIRDKIDEAVQLFRRENQATEDALGADHVDSLLSKNRLARALIKLGGVQNKTEAESLMRKTLEICKSKYDTKHPRYEKSLDDLIDLLYKTSKFSEAEKLCRQSLKLKDDRSDSSRETIACTWKLGKILYDGEKLHEALYVIAECLRLKTERFGDNHIEALETATFLAKIHRKLGGDDEAVKIIRRTLKARMKACRHKLERCTARFESFIEDVAYEGRLIAQFEKFESTVKALQKNIEDTETSLKF